MRVELFATVSGSFRKHLREIRIAVDALRDAGVRVLSPKLSRPVSNSGDFVYLEGDSGTPTDIEINHLNAIMASDFLYVVNPKGYLGTSGALEMGFARAHRIPIFCRERPADSMLDGLVQYSVPVPEIAKTIAAQKRRRAMSPLSEGFTLPDVQSYIEEMVRQKGFAEESLRDVGLLLMEEMGELAKAIRESSGLQVRKGGKKSGTQLADEMADCFIYIVDLANLAGIDFERAVRSKLASNLRRQWSQRSQERAK